MTAIEKYLQAGRNRLVNYLPLGVEICEYCKSQNSRISNRCSKCGAEMQAPLGWCFGVPVFDASDAHEIMTNGFISNDSK